MENILKLLILHSALGFVFLPGSQGGLIIKGPKSVSVALGENATFDCLAETSAKKFDWFMNGTKCTCDPSDVTSTCTAQSCWIMTKKETLNVNLTTEITVDTDYDYNNASFKCMAYIDDCCEGGYVIVDEENSSLALLTVQGLLAAPGNMSASAISCRTTSLFWNEPYSLPEVDILGYQVILEGIQLENGTTFINNSVLKPNWTKSFEECQDPCKSINASVAGKNQVGTGTSSFATFYFLGAPEFLESSHSLHYSTASPSQLQLQVSVELQSANCVGRIPKVGNISINCSVNAGSEASFSQNYSFVPMWLGNTYTINATGIPQNLHCNYTLSLSSAEDLNSSIMQEDLTTTAQVVKFSTHAIQAVHVQQIPGEGKVCIICTFLVDSQASGCQVILLCEGEAQPTLTIPREVGSVNVTCIASLISVSIGTCDVEAYVVDSTDSVSEILAASTTLEIKQVFISSTTTTSGQSETPSVSCAVATGRTASLSTTISEPSVTPSTARVVGTVLASSLAVIAVAILIGSVVVCFVIKRRKSATSIDLPSQHYSELARRDESVQANPKPAITRSDQRASPLDEPEKEKVLLKATNKCMPSVEELNQADDVHERSRDAEVDAVSAKEPLLEDSNLRSEKEHSKERVCSDPPVPHNKHDKPGKCSSLQPPRHRVATLPRVIMRSASEQEKEALVSKTEDHWTWKSI